MLAAVAGRAARHQPRPLHLAMQVLEAASIIGLIRRTQSLTGRVGVVAGVLGLFRRDRVLAVGGYDGRDGDRGHRPDLEAAAWPAGRRRTSRARSSACRCRRPCRRCGRSASAGRAARARCCTPTSASSAAGATTGCGCSAFESVASLIWVVGLACSLVFAVLNVFFGESLGFFGFGLAWGVAISVVATIQLIVALALRHQLRPLGRARDAGRRALPAARSGSSPRGLRSPSRSRRWCAARGEQRVVWDIPRERLDSTSP